MTTDVFPPADSMVPPLSLYVHFPWCAKKCPYCDFNSHPLRGALDEDRYIDALLADLAVEVERWQEQRPVQSIFLGGGTPSLFSAPAIERLLQGIAAHLVLDADIEVTLETNPGSAERGNFAGYAAAGVNRISLGIQSFNDNLLRTLGRVHNGDEARHAIDALDGSGIENFNLDLMFALPEQDIAMCLEDVETALSFHPPHLSLYQLTIEPNTWFHRHPPPLPDDEETLLLQERLHARLDRSGLRRYEISAFARDQRRCRHNVNYWRFGDYLGIGAGAHGKITSADGAFRYRKEKHPKRYLALASSSAATAETSVVPEGDLSFELLMNGLRLVEGVSWHFAERHAGLERGALLAKVQGPRQLGLLEVDGQGIRCTPRGYLLLDEILERLLPD